MVEHGECASLQLLLMSEIGIRYYRSLPLLCTATHVRCLNIPFTSCLQISSAADDRARIYTVCDHFGVFLRCVYRCGRRLYVQSRVRRRSLPGMVTKRRKRMKIDSSLISSLVKKEVKRSRARRLVHYPRKIWGKCSRFEQGNLSATRFCDGCVANSCEEC